MSHDVHETTQIADYVIIIFKGRVIGEGAPTALLNNPSEAVQQFLRGLADGPVTFHYPAKAYAEDLE